MLNVTKYSPVTVTYQNVRCVLQLFTLCFSQFHRNDGRPVGIFRLKA